MRRALFALVGCLGVAVPAAAAPPPRDARVDKAIANGLRFLHNTQEKDTGAWKVHGRPNPAITSLAVMAFLSAGHVPGEGRYGPTIEKGVRYVLSIQKNNGLIASDGNLEMYHHGIATLMLAEVAGMTQGELAKQVRRAVEKAVAVILVAQRTNGDGRGGWRYRVQHVNQSDVSVTGWQVMALRAARNLGCDVPAGTIDQAVAFLHRCFDDREGAFRYTPRDGVTVPCTGTSILALELCGKDRHNNAQVLRAGTFLLKNPPRWGSGYFFYSIYYCSQATFQIGGNYWSAFRTHLHDVLTRNQKANGSWEGRGGDDGQHGGPNYCTAMSILALTVEYRYLPIYQRGDEPTNKGKKR
jgi:hypothetical protein